MTASSVSLEFLLPDQNYSPEVSKYNYDSAGRLRRIDFNDAAGSRELYNAEFIDPLGRVLKARHGGSTVSHATYANDGRRLLQQVVVESALGSRRVIYGPFDPLGRERTRREIKDGAPDGPKTNVLYDALGRLSRAVQTDGTTTLFDWQYKYDPLGNVISLGDNVGSAGASLSYLTADPDRVCRIGYGNGGFGGNVCNVVHDGMGNATQEPTRTGSRTLSYYASGQVRGIAEGAALATFRYDAFGAVQELDITGNGVSDTRHDRHYGGLIERRDQIVNGNTTSFLARNIPGPDGVTASRRGTGDDWVFGFGEQRGNRYFTNQSGAFNQGVDFQPYGEARSTGLPSGAKDYVNYQWNGGDTLSAFGLSQLGARVYDPVIGRFLSRDSLFLSRTASDSNPYSFAFNDPLNHSDPTGLDSCAGDDLCISFDYGSSQDVEIAGALGAAWAGIDWITGLGKSNRPTLVDAGPVLRGVFDDAYKERYDTLSYLNRVANAPGAGELAGAILIGMPIKAALQAGCDVFACDNETGGGDTLVPDGHGGMRPDSYHPHRVSYARQAFNIAFNKAAGKATSRLLSGESRLPALEKAPSYCFSSGTKVLMADGSTKEIQNLHEGDLVIANDPEGKVGPAPHRVTQIHRNATYRFFHLRVGEGDGGEIVTTGSHPFWTAHGWTPAEKLTTKDVLRDDHAHSVAILPIPWNPWTRRHLI
jgi:RHS repeat-associated protein